MSETIRGFRGSTATARHPGRRAEYVVAALVLLVVLGSVALWVASARPVLPDRLQVLSTAPVPGSPGEVAVVARLSRADGGRMASYSSASRIVSPGTGTPLLQHQSGLSSSDRSHRYLDLTLQGTLQPQVSGVPALVVVEVRAVPIAEQLHWTAHNLSGNLIPIPRARTGKAQVLSCAVLIPGSVSAAR